MLKFCFKRLKEGKFSEEGDRYVYLEAFLLHARNLIEFFREGGRGGDLSMAQHTEWAPDGIAVDPNQVNLITQQAQELSEKYWDEISRYIQHCTIYRRNTDLSWNIDEVHSDILPILAIFLGIVKGG
jgi:hypothetical protein